MNRLKEAEAISLKRGTDLYCHNPSNDASRDLQVVKTRAVDGAGSGCCGEAPVPCAISAGVCDPTQNDA